MKNALIFCLFAAAIVSAQPKQRIAVLPTVGGAMEPEEQNLLTDKVRELAAKNLPIENFIILKQDQIIKRIGGEEELYRSCKEGVCIGDLAKRIDVDYGSRCEVVKVKNRLVLKFELYSVSEDAIFETFIDHGAKDIFGMLTVLEKRLPEAFKKMVSAYGSHGTAGGGGASQSGLEIEMVHVAGGTFTMGCTAEQGSDCYSDEKPSRRVTLNAFLMGKYEVTQGQWKAVMGENPSHFKGDDNLPVESVSWDDVQKFIQKLNSITGKKYRLPTEAEWEYAARGGNKSRGYKYSGGNNIDGAGWYVGNSGDRPLDNAAMMRLWSSQKYDEYAEKIRANNNRTRPVGTKTANELGIHDMSGNVYEWVSDWYGSYSSSSVTNPKGPGSGSSRVFRGGGWGNGAQDCRVSNRTGYSPDDRSNDLGFRLAVSP